MIGEAEIPVVKNIERIVNITSTGVSEFLVQTITWESVYHDCNSVIKEIEKIPIHDDRVIKAFLIKRVDSYRSLGSCITDIVEDQDFGLVYFRIEDESWFRRMNILNVKTYSRMIDEAKKEINDI